MNYKYKVCAYAICKNEEQFVDRWMNHASEADLLVVVDTGSTDHTVEKLKQRGAIVYKYEIEPFRFDYSRNYCLNLIPNDVDICVSSDLDDSFRGRCQQNQSFHCCPCPCPIPIPVPIAHPCCCRRGLTGATGYKN